MAYNKAAAAAVEPIPHLLCIALSRTIPGEVTIAARAVLRLVEGLPLGCWSGGFECKADSMERLEDPWPRVVRDHVLMQLDALEPTEAPRDLAGSELPALHVDVGDPPPG